MSRLPHRSVWRDAPVARIFMPEDVFLLFCKHAKGGYICRLNLDHVTRLSVSMPPYHPVFSISA